MATPEGRQDLVRRYADGLYRWSWARAEGNPELAQELVQRVFLTAFERPEAYDPGRGEPWGWLLGLALNHLKALRRDRRHPVLEVENEPATEAGPHPMEAEESRRQVRRALTSLAPEMQSLLEEHDMKGRSLGQIARDLGLASSTAWDRLVAARDAFRKAMGEEYD